MYEDYRNQGFVALAINLSEDMAVVRSYARQNTNPYLRDNGTVWGIYRQNGYIPLNYVVDPDGVIRFFQEGFNEAVIRQVIEQYLPGQIEHDVGVVGIAAPTGTLDSGVVVTPRCSVFNYASNVETYPVRLRIGTEYDTTVTVVSHQPGTMRHVEFPDWSPRVRGQSAVTCTTELDGDAVGSNNRQRLNITVNVYDLAVTAILAPADSVDSGVAVVPRVEVRNNGTLQDMAKVRFFIGTSYVESTTVVLAAGHCDTASLRAWTPLELGTFAMRCTVGAFRPDMNLSNNLLTGQVRVVRVSGIEERPQAAKPGRFEARPNPARRSVAVEYSLHRDGLVSLEVYSAAGSLVRVLRSGSEQTGTHRVCWDGRDDQGRPAGPGAYYLRLAAADGTRIIRLSLLN